ncbi:hypothetical protein BDZ94DRAFT_1247642 [Collybia nuda]|uniref:Uncharacterized protein n=1 Tax=Collybia nuda TaxID=64659 RepID=A0A9P6CPK4_9AGAR|nr:hypothetical protein BDZ94DRAFT_1247642 [Collybia nuda]
MYCKFEFLEIYIQGQVYESQGLEQFTAALTQHPSCLTLKNLYFQCEYDAEDETSPNPRSPSQLLEPPFLSTALESVETYGPPNSGFDDRWLDEAVRAWKSLRRLNISGQDNPPQITLAGLIPLVRHCPHLYYIDLELQAIPMKPFLLKDVKNLNIFTLYLRNSILAVDPVLKFRVGQLQAWEQVNSWLCNSDRP